MYMLAYIAERTVCSCLVYSHVLLWFEHLTATFCAKRITMFVIVT